MQCSSCSFAAGWGARLWAQVMAQPGEGGCTLTTTLPLQWAPLGPCSTQHSTGDPSAFKGSSQSCTVTITQFCCGSLSAGSSRTQPQHTAAPAPSAPASEGFPGTAALAQLPWHSTKLHIPPQLRYQHCCHLSCHSPRGGFPHWSALVQKQNKSLLFPLNDRDHQLHTVPSAGISFYMVIQYLIISTTSKLSNQLKKKWLMNCATAGKRALYGNTTTLRLYEVEYKR